MKKEIVKPKKCECNFRPPHPFRVNPGNKAVFDDKEYPEEFFCGFCKRLIVNDMEYIKEVIKYHAQEDASSSVWYRNNVEDGKEYYMQMYLDKYKELV